MQERFARGENIQDEVVEIRNGSLDDKVEQQIVKEISYLQAMGEVASFAVPFTLSRAAVAVNVLANGLVIPHLGENATAAGSFMISGVYAVIGPARAVLLSTGILIGKLYGEMKEHLNQGNVNGARELQENIGQLLRDSIIFGTLLAIPSTAMLVFMKQILIACGIPPAVALQADGFMVGTSLGLLPMFWSTSDQQFALATGHGRIPLAVGTIFSGLTMLLGYPLALGSWGLPRLGPAGMGYGLSASAWLTFIGLRGYFLREEFAPYKLYQIQCINMQNFLNFIKLGFPLGFQSFSEWGNLAALSSLVGLRGKISSIASLGSFEIISSVSLISAALGQAVSVKISNMLGELRVLEEKSPTQLLATINDNIKRIGRAGIITGVLANTVLSAFLAGFSTQISAFFIDSQNVLDPNLIALARAMLYVNAIGLIFDTIRNVGGGALNGSKDVLFMPIISLVAMSVVGLSVGAGLSEGLQLSANWLFITRNVGILLASVGVTARLFTKNYLSNNENSSLIANSTANYCPRFSCSPRVVEIEEVNEEELEAERGSRCCTLF